jgi:DNA-directed RNA polymerase specialized sigma24 family protein
VSKNTPIEILINTRYSPKSDNVSFHEFMGDKKTINALDELVMDEVNDLLKSRLEHLDSRFSEPITEVFINEKSYEEAALSLNMNVSTLRSRLCRGKQLLKKIMEKKILQKRKGIGRARSQKASS